MRRLSILTLSFCLMACGGEAAEPAPKATVVPAADRPPEIERPYDESADAQAQIDAAVAASAGAGNGIRTR